VIPKPFSDILQADIEALVENKVREGRSIEYKACLPHRSDSDKKELLADVSSFANAGGGDLLYGVSATDGIPKEITGLEGNMDSVLLHLENLIRSGLDPRISGIQIRSIGEYVKGPVILIRIPRRWAAPHMVKLGKSSRFFIRNSAGKHQMDISEIRAAFSLSEVLPEKMKRFRDERLGRIITDETPVSLCKDAKLILHILPISSFTHEGGMSLPDLKGSISKLPPIGCSVWSHRYNFDGVVTYSGYNDGSGESSYCQIFRTGQIEAVYADFVRERDGVLLIPSVAYEEYVIQGVLMYVASLQDLEILPPLLLLICLTGVYNVYMGVDAFYFSSRGSPIDRDVLTLPEILIEDYAVLTNKNDVAKVLRPAFDAVWNACGFERSFNYDADGNWQRSSR